MDHSAARAKCFAGGGEWLGPSLAAARQLAMRSSQPVEGTLTTGDSSGSRVDRQGKRQDPWRVLEQLPDVRVSGGSLDSGTWVSELRVRASIREELDALREALAGNRQDLARGPRFL